MWGSKFILYRGMSEVEVMIDIIIVCCMCDAVFALAMKLLIQKIAASKVLNNCYNLQHITLTSDRSSVDRSSCKEL